MLGSIGHPWEQGTKVFSWHSNTLCNWVISTRIWCSQRKSMWFLRISIKCPMVIYYVPNLFPKSPPRWWMRSQTKTFESLEVHSMVSREVILSPPQKDLCPSLCHLCIQLRSHQSIWTMAQEIITIVPAWSVAMLPFIVMDNAYYLTLKELGLNSLYPRKEKEGILHLLV